jgi:hypothetical protein
MSGIRANWITLVLLAFALVLALDPWPFASPVRVAEPVPAGRRTRRRCGNRV